MSQNIKNGVNPLLFGFKPAMKSYTIRCLLLQLMIQTHGTDSAAKLKGGTLALCLLDMIYRFAVNNDTTYIYIRHPFTNRCIFFNMRDVLIKYMLAHLIRLLLEGKIQDINRFGLLNTDVDCESTFTAIYEHPIPANLVRKEKITQRNGYQYI